MSEEHTGTHSPTPRPEPQFGAAEARAQFAEIIGRVAYGGERIIITRNHKGMGVLISMDDYERFLAWEKAQPL